jgi:uncharacterized membrane protein YczE
MNENGNDPRMATMGCLQVLPIIMLIICRFIVGMPNEASKIGLIAYLVILIIGAFLCLSGAAGTNGMGLRTRSKIFRIGMFVFIGLAIYITVLLF